MANDKASVLVSEQEVVSVSQGGEMKALTVSVVIPSYNCGEYVGRAIESVLNQTYQPLECIVVNDGSTDNTKEAVALYADQVTLIEQRNQGASAARNAGIARAKGEYIAFLDADDYWHPSKLEKQVKLLQDHTDLVLVSTRLSRHQQDDTDRVQDEALSAQPYNANIADIHTDLLALLQNPYLGTPSVVVRTDRAREVGGFDVSLPAAEDLDFYFRICQNRSYARIRQPLTIVEVRKGSLTHTQPGYRLNLEVIDRVEQANPDFAKLHADEFTQQRLLVYENWITGRLRRGKGGDARALLRKSRQYGKVPSYGKLLARSFFANTIRKARLLLSQS